MSWEDILKKGFVEDMGGKTHSQIKDERREKHREKSRAESSTRWHETIAILEELTGGDEKKQGEIEYLAKISYQNEPKEPHPDEWSGEEGGLWGNIGIWGKEYFQNWLRENKTKIQEKFSDPTFVPRRLPSQTMYQNALSGR